MSFRLRHRAKFDAQAVAAALRLRTPRLHPPPQWDWAWPLHESDSESATAVQNDAVRRAWVSAVRAVAVADDASAIAFVSHDDGHVALLTLSNSTLVTCKSVQLDNSIENDPVATSIALFSIALSDSAPAQSLLAVGYKSGLVAIFDVATAQLLAITRPSSSLPVRRLRFYPAFHLVTSGPMYPLVNSNGGLFAVLGWAGTLARFPATEIGALIAKARESGTYTKDERGAGWVVWHTTAQDAVLEATVCGSDPSSICELDVSPPAAPLRVATAGVNPPIASYSVTTDPAFSARDAAKRAASSVLSAARGFLLSRISYAPEPTPIEQERKAVTGITRFSTSWADDATFGQPLINFGDVRSTARKSVAAVLTRGRKPMDVDGATASESYRRLSKGSTDANKVPKTVTFDSDRIDIQRILETQAADIMKRQRSRFSGEQVAHAARVPQNARVIERISAAPVPCTLFATSDTLGRVFIQDSRDLCVLRVLKGYREAHIAWLAQGGPLLAVYAPRLNVMELHRPLDVKREAAFVLDSGSMIVQSTSHHVFCVAPDGVLRELAKTRKAQSSPSSLAAMGHNARPRDQLQAIENEAGQRQKDDVSKKHKEEFVSRDKLKRSSADYESVGTFVEAVKRSQTSIAVDCLQNNEDDIVKVAHLMATLVTCTQYIRTEVHIALASKAAEIAANLQHTDLKLRFEAHSGLAEAFGLLVAEMLPEDPGDDERRISRYGHRLLEDELGSGLVEFAVEELTQKNVARIDGKRMRTNTEEQAINCERFILSHELRPTADLRSEAEYVLTPRQDLSRSEQVWLAKAYFSRLLEVDSGSTPVEGREHPTTKDVFFALFEVMELTEIQFTRQFIRFFLYMPLLTLLSTHAATYASPIRCAILRMQEEFSREEVDGTLIEECMVTTRIPNAVLLLRLCGAYENLNPSRTKDSSLEGCLDRLEEVLLYRKLIAGSAIPSEVFEKFTAKHCTGLPGDAERHAVTCLIDWNDFDRASKILMGLDVSRKRQSLEWHESASISEAALHCCRRKSASFITETTAKVLPKSVVSWILAVKPTEKHSAWEQMVAKKREYVLREIRAVLLSAHQYFPDSSTDAVRCLQLAEAMSTMIELEAGGDAAGAILSAVQKSSNGDTFASVEATGQETQNADNLQLELAPEDDSITLPVPILSNEMPDSEDRSGVPVMGQDSSDVVMGVDIDEERSNSFENSGVGESDDENFQDASAEALPGHMDG